MKPRTKTVIVVVALAVLGSIVLSIEDIIAGKFPSALDKEGKNGVLVEVDGLRVTGVWNESEPNRKANRLPPNGVTHIFRA